MHSRIPKLLGSPKSARTCCVKHRDEAKPSQFESASNFTISKGDFSAIQGHRYGALHITGKTVVIQQGSVSRKQTRKPIRTPTGHEQGYRYDSDSSDVSTSSSIMMYSEERRTLCLDTLRRPGRARPRDRVSSEARYRRLDEREALARICEDELEARAEAMREKEAESGRREQFISAREGELDQAQKAMHDREAELWSWENRLRMREEGSRSKEVDIQAREAGVQKEEERVRTRTGDLDVREKKLDLRELELDRREKDLLVKGEDLESREASVKKSQEELKQMEQGLWALGSRIKEQVVALQEQCAHLQRVKANFSMNRDEWTTSASARAMEMDKIQKDLIDIFSEFSCTKTSSVML